MYCGNSPLSNLDPTGLGDVSYDSGGPDSISKAQQDEWFKNHDIELTDKSVIQQVADVVETAATVARAVVPGFENLENAVSSLGQGKVGDAAQYAVTAVAEAGTATMTGALAAKAATALGAKQAAKAAAASASKAAVAASKVPSKFTDTLKTIQDTGKAPAGFKGGSTFANDGRAGGQVLPKTDAAGNPVTYKEWDVNPYQKGLNRGAERIVTCSDGQAYYTTDHYKTFNPME